MQYKRNIDLYPSSAQHLRRDVYLSFFVARSGGEISYNNNDFNNKQQLYLLYYTYGYTL